MNNPWKDINLSDYENHMALDSVWQLQEMNQMMKGQLNQYDIQSVTILGIAGGNGLGHVHHQMAEQELQNSIESIGYRLIQTLDYLLPNGKKLVQLDFCNNIAER